MMADLPSSGGGKIRSRRTASSRKPYSRATSQRKSLFSRVTDSFRTILNPITPKWLTNRMSHSKDENAASSSTDTVTQSQEVSSNHSKQRVHTNNNYKSSPLGRPALSSGPSSSSSLRCYVTPPDTPPSSGASETPSGGKQDLVKHLTMSSKRIKMSSDGPVMRSDESALRKELGLLSANDNASVASSSGCSSSMQAGQCTDISADNEGSQRNLWSSSMDSLASSKTSQQQPIMPSQKKPRFNPAVFGIPAMASPSRTPDMLQSSFYSGPTQYGGASARSPYFATPYKVPSVTKVKVRHLNHHKTPRLSSSSLSSSRSSKSPLDESEAAGMSSTARKILQTLERMSSPLNDARKIPSTVNRTPSSFMAERQRRRTIGSMLQQAPPTTSLSAPSSAKIRRSFKMPLNNSLLLKTAMSSKDRAMSPIEDRDRKSPVSTAADIPDSLTISTRGVPAPLSSLSSSVSKSTATSMEVNPGAGGGGGKMKNQRRTTSHYSAMHKEEIEDAPDLPAVALPLRDTSHLPSFNFGKSLMTSTPAIRTQSKKKSNDQPEFNFASPVVKTTMIEQNQAPGDTPRYQFSSPPMRTNSSSNEQDTPKTSTTNFSAGSKPSTPSLMFTPDPKVVSSVRAAKRKSSPAPAECESPAQQEGGFRPAEKLKAGSVMDILSGKSEGNDGKSSNATSTAPSSHDTKLKNIWQSKSGWDCDTCMLHNEAGDKKCVACETPKQGARNTTALSGFGQSKGWTCDTCLVPNEPSVETCVACSTPKPGSAAPKAPSTLQGSSSFKKQPDSTFSFGIPKSKTEVKKVDAESKFPPIQSSWGSSMNKSSGTWDCDVCLVPNDASSTSCEACNTPKPGSKTSAKSAKPQTDEAAPKFTFGRPNSSSSSASSTAAAKSTGWGSQFKKGSMWECEMCMVSNPDDRKTCEACESPKPGTEKKETLNSSFKFGGASSGLIKFGVPTSKGDSDSNKKDSTENEEQGKSTSVLFGQQSTTKEQESAGKSPVTFSFGAPKTTVSASATEPDKPPAKAELALPSFSFGAKPKQIEADAKTEAPDKDKPLFSFGAPKKDDAETGKASPSMAAPAATVPSFGQQPLPAAATSAQPPPAFGASVTSSTNSGTPGGFKPLFGSSAPGKQSTIPAFGKTVDHTPLGPAAPPAAGLFAGFQSKQAEPTAKPDAPKPAPANAPFAFGSSAPASGAFQFSASASLPKPTTEPASNTGFSFGAKPGSASSAPIFGSSQPATTAATSVQPPAFKGFGSQPQSAAPVSQPSAASQGGFKGFNFGSSQPAAQTTSGGMFGSNTASTNPTPFGSNATKPSPFGQPATNPSPFGGPSSTPSTGMFGSTTPSAPAFGAPAATTANQGIPKPSFSFGSTNSAPIEQKKQSGMGFQFTPGNLSNTPQQPPSGFSFGTPATKPAPPAFNATPVPAFQFGGSNAQQQSNGMFQFGASSNQQKPEPAAENKSGMFVFGGNNLGTTTSSAPPASTGFSFGAAGTTPSGFNFGANQPAAPQGGGAMFPMSETAPNQNPFSATAGRSTTPVQGGRRVIRQARRKLRK